MIINSQESKENMMKISFDADMKNNKYIIKNATVYLNTLTNAVEKIEIPFWYNVPRVVKRSDNIELTMKGHIVSLNFTYNSSGKLYPSFYQLKVHGIFKEGSESNNFIFSREFETTRVKKMEKRMRFRHQKKIPIEEYGNKGIDTTKLNILLTNKELEFLSN